MIVLPLQLFITLDTKFHAKWEMGQTFIAGPVRLVTAHAIEREVLIPRIYRFYSYWVRRMLRKVVALRADIYHGRLGKQQDSVGSMRRMAGRAHSFLNRIVLGNGFFLP
jgi:hypothetical protein